jgi:large subunit ribosomal protein L32
MGALPKRKHSKGRRDRRRAHDFLTPAQLVECGNCHEKHQPHTVCPNCGQYNGRAVLEVEAAKKKS